MTKKYVVLSHSYYATGKGRWYMIQILALSLNSHVITGQEPGLEKLCLPQACLQYVGSCLREGQISQVYVILRVPLFKLGAVKQGRALGRRSNRTDPRQGCFGSLETSW